MGNPKTETLQDLQTLNSAGAVGRLTDGELLRRFATRGEEAAFAVLVERHGPMVLRVCQAVLGDRHDAQDACQATFLVLARRAGSIRRADSVSSWLHGVARRVAVRARSDAARRREGERRVARRVAETRHDDPPRVFWAELHEEIDPLPERYRAPIVLCGLEGRTHEEAAQQLAWPVGTVKVRLARARRVLGARLVRRGLASSALVVGSFPSPSPAEMAGQIGILLRAAARPGSMAGVVPASTAALADAVSRSLLVAKLQSVAGTLLAVCGISLIAAWTFRPIAGAQPPPANVAPPAKVEAKPKPAADASRIDERLKDFLYAEIGNMRPVIHDEAGYRFQSREAILYKDGTVKIYGFQDAPAKIDGIGPAELTKEPICPPLRDKTPIREFTFFDHSGLLVTISDDAVKLWDGLTGKLRKELEGQTIRPLYLSYTPTGGRFITIDGERRKVTVWDAKTLDPVAMLRWAAEPQPPLLGAALSGDGKTAVTFGEEQTVTLWDVAGARAFATLRPPSPAVTELFAESGKTLNRSKVEHSAHFWELVRSLAPAARGPKD